MEVLLLENWEYNSRYLDFFASVVHLFIRVSSPGNNNCICLMLVIMLFCIPKDTHWFCNLRLQNAKKKSPKQEQWWKKQSYH